MMTSAGRRFLAGILLILAAGALIGWLYDQVVWGLLVAALLTLGWQVRQLLSFDKALKTDNFDNFRYGDGIWEQIFSRFRFERERAIRRKAGYRGLLREIRKSTNAMPDGAVILDVNNEIVTCNRAAKQLAGLKRKKDRGQRIDNILRAPELTELLRRGDYENSVELRSPIKDGDWLNCRVVPYGAEQKLLLLRDVTERMQLARMRRDFVANASHELRSPLTVINGYLDALAEADDLPETWVKPVTQMRNQSRRMNTILTELLELSRLESTGTAAMDETIDVADLLQKVCSDFDAPTGGPDIVVKAESSALLRGAATEIESLIVNLLSNAVRHTPQGGSVTLSWRSGQEGATLSVADTGEGIDPMHIPRLTERFFRVDRGRSRGEGGVGLGLAIVKHVLSRHDAELQISSEPGVGSEFRCVFPAERVVVAPPVSLS